MRPPSSSRDPIKAPHPFRRPGILENSEASEAAAAAQAPASPVAMLVTPARAPEWLAG